MPLQNWAVGNTYLNYLIKNYWKKPEFWPRFLFTSESQMTLTILTMMVLYKNITSTEYFHFYFGGTHCLMYNKILTDLKKEKVSDCFHVYS